MKVTARFTPAIANITRKSKTAGRPAKIVVVKKKAKPAAQKKTYKVPKTPKVSGKGWGY